MRMAYRVLRDAYGRCNGGNWSRTIRPSSQLLAFASQVIGNVGKILYTPFLCKKGSYDWTTQK
jgi:hypothetical protein